MAIAFGVLSKRISMEHTAFVPETAYPCAKSAAIVEYLPLALADAMSVEIPVAEYS